MRNTGLRPCSTSGAGASSGPQRCCRRSGRFTQKLAMAAVAEKQASVTGGTEFLRPHLLKLAAYTPIEPFEILSERYGRKPEDIIKLDANENPYGPPPEVREALGKMAFPHVYPDPETRQLRKALAQMNDIPIEHLLVGPRGVAYGMHGRCMEGT